MGVRHRPLESNHGMCPKNLKSFEEVCEELANHRTVYWTNHSHTVYKDGSTGQLRIRATLLGRAIADFKAEPPSRVGGKYFVMVRRTV